MSGAVAVLGARPLDLLQVQRVAARLVVTVTGAATARVRSAARGSRV